MQRWNAAPVSGGENADRAKPDHPSLPRAFQRELPSLSYAMRRRPAGVLPLYAGPAIFASFPISRIVVIRGDGSDEALQRTGRASLPVELEDL